jgi:small subunit ribosomal protein S18
LAERTVGLASGVNAAILAGFREALWRASLRGVREGFISMMFKKRPVRSKRKARARTKAKKKDPIFVNGERPRPMYVDYKDVELLKKLVNRHGRIVVRRKTGCSAVSQRAVTLAIKRARFMALLPYVGD